MFPKHTDVDNEEHKEQAMHNSIHEKKILYERHSL